jgi:hypothetical protein
MDGTYPPPGAIRFGEFVVDLRAGELRIAIRNPGGHTFPEGTE